MDMYSVRLVDPDLLEGRKWVFIRQRGTEGYLFVRRDAVTAPFVEQVVEWTVALGVPPVTDEATPWLRESTVIEPPR